ncbi:hypothetical protein LX32DRAFT_115626 [Colletotrichum zoysiae]|uniref:Secreted protein n=1 Tax=Colletotrichum zoysiae TaxID=1216348 RepID=A0AAD9H978_9PEZI|nr:hypothetical protein LX32DRAFT_115626 [Colletotrichum zoysiae]
MRLGTSLFFLIYLFGFPCCSNHVLQKPGCFLEPTVVVKTKGQPASPHETVHLREKGGKPRRGDVRMPPPSNPARTKLV